MKPRGPDLFSWTEARARADDGIARAVDHADDVDPEWSARAMACVVRYARLRGEPFLAEDARLASDIEDPPDGRAWGAVLQRARRAGLIEMVGYSPARSSNCSPKCLWLACRHS